jgi:hypothetical protein
MANICRSLRTKFFFSPVLKSLTHIGFIGVKKMGQKSHTWAPLRLHCSEEGVIFTSLLYCMSTCKFFNTLFSSSIACILCVSLYVFSLLFPFYLFLMSFIFLKIVYNEIRVGFGRWRISGSIFLIKHISVSSESSTPNKLFFYQ